MGKVYRTMGFYVAIDAGGTKTQVWVADEHRVLGRSLGGTVKLMNVGADVASQRLQELVTEARHQAGVAGDQVTRTCLGLAGSGSATVKRWAESTLRSVVGGEVMVCGDEEIALDAAFQGESGVLVIAGTGSNVVGRCADGTIVTAGGWGPVLGDEGSGYWIGLEAVKEALRAVDRGLETTVLDAVMKHWGLKELHELVAKGNQQPRPAFSELTVVIQKCAQEGDVLASSLLEWAGEELGAQVELVVEKMKAAGCAAKKVAYTGSVVEKMTIVKGAMVARLAGSLPGVAVAEKGVEALEGALWRARGSDKR